MRRSKVVLEFLRYPVSRKVEYGRNVIAKMTGNASFPSPDLTLTVAATLCTNLEQAAVAADGGGKAATSNLNIAEKAWDDGFRKLAMYVDRIANGAENLILISGFDASRQPEAALRPEFHAENTKHAGEVLLAHKSLRKRAAWVWQYAPDPVPSDGAGWTLANVTLQAKCVISGLESGKLYWFRVCLVSASAMDLWSVPFPLRVM
ncbi:MAG: hypothetical protein V2A54_04875 [Bacteroidota bacterium]